MKNMITIPVAVVAAAMFPRVKQELVPAGEVGSLEKAVARQQSAKREFEKLLDRVRAGEKLSLEALFPKSEASKDASALLSLRQEVTTLQEEYEALYQEASGAPPEEEESASDEKSPEEPKPHPLVKPDRSRLGAALYRAGNFDEALLALEMAGDPWSQFLAASCKERLGRVDEAIVDFDKLAEKSPETGAGKQAKTVSEYLKKRNKLGKASDYEAYLAEIAAQVLQDAPESATSASNSNTEKK